MPNQHAHPTAISLRLDPDLRDRATAALTARDREMRAFVVACLHRLVADPDRFLADLDAHWPAPSPRGRPRSAPSEE